MNCCDEYGNCRQGRDCPIHQEMCELRVVQTKSWWQKFSDWCEKYFAANKEEQ